MEPLKIAATVVINTLIDHHAGSQQYKFEACLLLYNSHSSVTCSKYKYKK